METPGALNRMKTPWCALAGSMALVPRAQAWVAVKEKATWGAATTHVLWLHSWMRVRFEELFYAPS